MVDYFEEARQTDTTTAVTTADTTPETTALAAPSTEGSAIMAYPPGVSLATITIGAGRTMFGAAPKLISATVTPIFVGTPHVVHAASGWPFYPTPRTFRVENGEELTFELPHVNAEGWRDTAGNEFPALLPSGERDRGWAYHAKFTVIGGSGQDSMPHRYEKVFQPLVGQTDPLDIDLVPDGQIGAPVSAPIAVVTSVNGQTGPVNFDGVYLTAEDGAALADAAGDQAVIDAGTYTDEQLSGYVQKSAAILSVSDYGAVGDGIANDAPALTAALAAAKTGNIIDLAGRTLAITSPVTIGKGITIRNGAVKAGPHTVFTVTAPDVTFRDLNISRSTTSSPADNLGQKSAVVVQGARFRSLDCNYTDAAHACIYIVHGQGNGTLVRGGRFSNSVAVQNGCAVYAAAGVSRNLDITVEGITVEHTGSPDGILIYDSSRCTMRGNTLRNLRGLPERTMTGWSLVSGTTWRTLDRTDGKTRVLIFNGTEMTETTAGAGENTTPAANNWGWGTDGYLYVNSTTDPNTVTVLSRIVSGYALLFYSTTNATSGMCDNLVADNIVEDCDGFGIYLQLDRSDALRNGTRNNRLTNVCLRGEQSNKLPFAAIGAVGGSDLTFIGDTVDKVGSTQYPAPGFRVNPPRINGDGTANTNGACNGTVVGLTVTRATRAGIYLHGGTWSFVGCRSNYNTGCGFETFRASNSFIINATLSGCEAIGNGIHGVAADNAGYPGAVFRVSVVGGEYRENASRGVAFNGAQDSKVVGATAGPNGGGQAQLWVGGTSTRILLADNTIPSGTVGVLVVSTTTDVVVGAHTIASWVTTPVSYTAPIRVGGVGGNTPTEWVGAGSPEGVVTARVGSTYRRTDGGAGTSTYVKEANNTTATGWVAK